MLIITRRVGESFMIGDQHVEVFVKGLKDGVVSLGIKAPHDVAILRSELVDKANDAPFVRDKRTR